MEAVKDLGFDRVTMRNTGGTDHQSFDAVGLPGFQFIQDPIEYWTGSFFGTHHTTMDTYDRLQREDLMQAAVVIATFAYHAAMRDEMLPRKPQPPGRRAGDCTGREAGEEGPEHEAGSEAGRRAGGRGHARPGGPLDPLPGPVVPRPAPGFSLGLRPQSARAGPFAAPAAWPRRYAGAHEPRPHPGDQGAAAAEGHERPRHHLRRRDPVAHRPRLGGRGAQDRGRGAG